MTRRKWCWPWVGHILQKGKGNITKEAMFWTPDGGNITKEAMFLTPDVKKETRETQNYLKKSSGQFNYHGLRPGRWRRTGKSDGIIWRSYKSLGVERTNE